MKLTGKAKMKAVRHVGITVKDLKKALKFYNHLLGLKLVKKMDESGAFISRISGLRNIKVTTVKLAADDNSLVELLLYYSHPAKKLGKSKIYDVGISHFAFTVEDVDKTYKRLLRAGVRFNSPPQVSPDGYAKVGFCRDFEGNLIELVQVL